MCVHLEKSFKVHEAKTELKRETIKSKIISGDSNTLSLNN